MQRLGDGGARRGERLDAFAVDERAVPQLEIQQGPQRVATLGGNAKGTVQAVTSTTKLPAFPVDDHNGTSLTTALADRYAAHAKSVRAAIDEADGLGDKVTADLFTGITRGLDKDLWFLESHISK